MGDGFLVVFRRCHHGPSFTLVMKPVIIAMVMYNFRHTLSDAFERRCLLFAYLLMAQLKQNFRRRILLLYYHIINPILEFLLRVNHAKNSRDAIFIIGSIIKITAIPSHEIERMNMFGQGQMHLSWAYHEPLISLKLDDLLLGLFEPFLVPYSCGFHSVAAGFD